MTVMDKIERNIVFRGLLNVERVVMVISSILAAAFVFAGVCIRYILKANFFGQEEILCIVAMWLYWVGGIYGTYEGSHIKGDLLSSLFKSSTAKKLVELIVLAISFFVIIVFCVWGWQYMTWNLKFMAVTTGLKLPMFYSQFPLLLGFLLMAFYTLFNFFRVLLNPKFGVQEDDTQAGGDA